MAALYACQPPTEEGGKGNSDYEYWTLGKYEEIDGWNDVVEGAKDMGGNQEKDVKMAVKVEPRSGSESWHKTELQIAEVADTVGISTGISFDQIMGNALSLASAADYVTDDAQLTALAIEVTDELVPFVNQQILGDPGTSMASMVILGLFRLNMDMRKIENKTKALWLEDKWLSVYYAVALGKVRQVVEDLAKAGREMWEKSREGFLKGMDEFNR